MNENQGVNNKLKEYIELVINRFKVVFEENNKRKPIYLLKSRKQRIIDTVLELESESIFADLVDITWDWCREFFWRIEMVNGIITWIVLWVN